jgi:hypothetical protein
MGGGGGCCGLFGVEALEVGVAVKHDKFRVAASPDGIVEASFPRFAQGIESFGLPFQSAKRASRIV